MVTSEGKIDVARIRAALFDDPVVWARIAQSYKLAPTLSGALAEQAIVAELGPQEVFGRQRGIDDGCVFHAAVWAIASNSRPWKIVHTHKDELKKLLSGYDPSQVARSGQTIVPNLEILLPGLTSTRDTTAILAWAEYLSKQPDFYGLLSKLRTQISEIPGVVDEAAANVLTAVAIAWSSPERVWPECRLPKTPGMGPVLASEFLRNLGWSMCKPDRHVGALLDGWLGTDATLRARSDELTTKVCKTKDRSVRDYVYRSMLMIKRRPEGIKLFDLDQLVWLYGSMAKARSSKVKCAD